MFDMPLRRDIVEASAAGHQAARTASFALKTMTAMMISTIPTREAEFTRAP